MTAYAKRVGAVRPSQLMFTFGVGSIVDLPNFSAVVGGLDDWAPGASAQHQRTLEEPRLLAAVRHDCGPQVQALKTPAWLPETRNVFDEWARQGVPVFPFPRWLRCTQCGYLGQYDGGLFKLDENTYRPDLTRFVHETCPKKHRKGSRAVPARLVVACVQGHLDEFPWMHFVHQGPPCANPRLVAQESGTGSRSTDVFVRCEGCDQGRMLNLAFTDGQEGRLPGCRGRHAHLRRFDENCGQTAHPLLLGASNLWFPVTRSALSLPATGDPLEAEVERLWDRVKDIPDADLPTVIKYTPELATLKPFGDTAVQAIIARRTSPAPALQGAPDLTLPEWRLFTQPQFAPSSPDFKVRAVAPPVGFEKLIERTVLVERLREVVAMVGFTRVDGVDADGGGGGNAPLCREPKTLAWVPAAESRGEGIFLQLPEAAVDAWCDQVSATDRMDGLRKAHHGWRDRRGLDAGEWPGARYLLLHTLSHALINEFALECGYSAASIRERIYAAEASGSDPAMAGILLYTAAPDSEGTLGGLVALGEPETLGRLLRQALEKARLCSTDPMCADHVPDEGEDALHNAACHACVLVPETSCERANHYLDRAVLTDTLAAINIHYFP
jgi:hypothetical protein